MPAWALNLDMIEVAPSPRFDLPDGCPWSNVAKFLEGETSGTRAAILAWLD
jgi:hypothetical protein